MKFFTNCSFCGEKRVCLFLISIDKKICKECKEKPSVLPIIDINKKK